MKTATCHPNRKCKQKASKKDPAFLPGPRNYSLFLSIAKLGSQNSRSTERSQKGVDLSLNSI